MPGGRSFAGNGRADGRACGVVGEVGDLTPYDDPGISKVKAVDGPGVRSGSTPGEGRRIVDMGSMVSWVGVFSPSNMPEYHPPLSGERRAGGMPR